MTKSIIDKEDSLSCEDKQFESQMNRNYEEF